MPRSADLPICLFASCESPQRCYISTDRSGILPSVNSIFNVFTYLYSPRVRAKAHRLFHSEVCVFVSCLCIFSMCFLQFFKSHYDIYEEVYLRLSTAFLVCLPPLATASDCVLPKSGF